MTMNNKHLFFIIILLQTIAQLIATDSGCLSFDILLTQNIDKAGFHRELKWLLEITNPSKDIISEQKCSFIMQLDMPQGAFVNPDELADLDRMNKLKTVIDGFVDVELIEHEASNHTVYIIIETDDYSKVSIDLPFHLRYQRAQLTGGYGKVILPKPIILARCSQKIRKLCHRSTVMAPCHLDNLKKCRWTNVTYKALFDIDEVLVPVGDLDHYPIVSIVSLLIGCIGCIYVLSLLSMFSKKPFLVMKTE
ncbi:phosphatidylinositol-glycan biosynthesis class X protein-like isoform X2 [Harmonia axyridis]|nr:phosphatidylinositol-glycan biosynthesis class X protein-like isoform X2 [Harmonia axyridis]XP_045477175.1 phosphatidylinositol-glycan biosynthesis class X protein-like isoform X2 [Harmonia axyridis]XP_045477176.1 phosphatidylinositol-glycan biosynthesis class X protein-like isoform X2 [Harmonia axyridis]XP_045477177.1 phosphatidylinositol-glycan biosynthesis class X protein-like isoform X2 [Harmonia axyridis]XP_045477178.1 phosphatidylinositol-glycan biosynthesis class X protein-like isofor